MENETNSMLTIDEYSELVNYCLEFYENEDDILPLYEGANMDYIAAYRENKKKWKENLKAAKKAIKADDKTTAKKHLDAAKNDLKNMEKEIKDVKDNGKLGTQLAGAFAAIGIESIHDMLSIFILGLYPAGLIGMKAGAKKGEEAMLKAVINNTGNLQKGMEAVDKAGKVANRNINIAFGGSMFAVISWAVKQFYALYKDSKVLKEEVKKNPDAMNYSALYSKLLRYNKEMYDIIAKIESKL